jgi:hypothetical protein
MFFTQRGLEQATDEVVAAHKARRFAGQNHVFDLCAGIGGDLLALGRVARVSAFDRDPVMAVLAEANARVLEDAGADGARHSPSVRALDVAQIDVGDCAAWHIDPDRRPRGRRTTRVERHEPGVDAIERLLARNPRAAVKLAPAASLPESWPDRAELEWISRGRECRALLAWFGPLASHAGRRRATILNAMSAPRSVVGLPGQEPCATNRVGRYVFEPDAAVLAARLAATLAAELGLAPITPGIAYWTGDAAIDDPALGCFEVREVLPFDVKRVKALMRARNVGRLEIKKRGVDVDPQRLRRQLQPSGAESATLLAMPIDGRVTAILAARIMAS